MSDVSINLLNHQYEFCTTDSPFPAIVGGLGSGKSQAGTDRLLLLMLEDNKINTLYAMPTFDLLKLRALTGFEESLQRMGLKYRVNKSEMTINIDCLGTIYLRSYDNPNRFIAFEVGHAVVDEIDTLKKEDAELVWRKVSERVRQNTKMGYNTIGAVTTPDQGLNGFVFNKWKKSPSKGYELIKASTYDNPFLPDGYTDQILANYDPILADLYLKGEFVSLTQNKQFWAFDRLKHHSDEVIKESDTMLNYAIDFNVGGTCVVIFKRIADKLIAVDEIVANTTQEAILKIDTRYPKQSKTCFPDASGGNESANADETSLGLIRQAGHRINAPKANPSVKSSINAVNNLLSKDRLLVNTDKCPSLTEALEALGYDDKGKPEKSHQHPAHDDWGDVTRYICNRLYPVRRPTTITKGT